MPNHIPGSIQKILSHKRAAIIILIIALLNKIFVAYVNYSLVGDKSLYTLMSMNAISGHGLSETFFFIEQPSHAWFLFNHGIATPGYSMALAPFLLLTGKNILLSNLFVEGLGWLIILSSAHSILKKCNCTPVLINVAMLVIGFFLYPHEFVSGPKDSLSVGLLLAATLYLLSVVNSKKTGWAKGMIAGILCALPGIVKAIYILPGLSMVFALLVVYLYKSERRLLLAFFVSLFTCLFLVTAVKLWDIYMEGNQPAYPAYTLWSIVTSGNEFARGFFLSNLSLTYPFTVSSFLNLDFLGVQISHYFSATYSQVIRFFQFLNASILAFLFIRAIFFFSRLRKNPFDNRNMLVIVGSLITVSLLGSLAIMSVIFGAVQYKGSGLGTYVSEGRSFLYVMFFLQILCFVFVFPASKPWFSVSLVVKWLLAFCFTITTLHGLYYSMKNVIELNKSLQRNRVITSNDVLDAALLEEKKYPDKKIMLVTQQQQLRWLATLRGDTIYCDPSTLDKRPMAVPANTVVMTIIFKDETILMKNYIQQARPKIVELPRESVLLVQE